MTILDIINLKRWLSMTNENNNISAKLPKDLKIQLDILATENHMTVDNLIIHILNNYVENEFSDSDNIIE